MRILLIGYGKMGKLVHELAPSQNSEIVRTLSHQDPLSLHSFEGIDVAIDFSSPEQVLERIQLACEAHVPIVVGTTGWHEKMGEAEALVKKSGGSCLASANFAIGVQLYMQLIRKAAKLLSRYDVALFEEHHNQKKDAPSGTAKELARILLEEIPEKKETLSVSALRCGFQPGKHGVIFDGPDDTIEIVHTARNRAGFARGALTAARWLQGKTGFYTIEDLLS